MGEGMTNSDLTDRLDQEVVAVLGSQSFREAGEAGRMSSKR